MKISNLPQATSVSDDDVVPVVQGGKTKKLPRGVLEIPEGITLRDNTLYLIHDGDIMGAGAEIPIVSTDQTYNPTSENPQSGKAVAEAVVEAVTTAKDEVNTTLDARFESAEWMTDVKIKNATRGYFHLENFVVGSIDRTTGKILSTPKTHLISRKLPGNTNYIFKLYDDVVCDAVLYNADGTLLQYAEGVVTGDGEEHTFSPEYPVRWAFTISGATDIDNETDLEHIDQKVYFATDVRGVFKLTYNSTDTEVKEGSENPVSGGAVYEALQNVEIDVDDEMSDTSTNPVQNKVIKAYVDSEISDIEKSVEEISSILDKPVNIYDKSKNTDKLVISASGVETVNSQYATTDYILLDVGSYTMTYVADGQRFAYMAKYDLDKTFKSRSNVSSGSINITEPCYVRFSGTRTLITEIMLVAGTELPAEYIPYKETSIKSEYIPTDQTFDATSSNPQSGIAIDAELQKIYSTMGNAEVGTIDPLNIDGAVIDNFYNLDTADVEGNYVIGLTGEIGANSTYKCFKVKLFSGKKYRINIPAFSWGIFANDVFEGTAEHCGLIGTGKAFEIPEMTDKVVTVFMCCTLANFIDNVIIVEGEELPTGDETYQVSYPWLSIKDTGIPEQIENIDDRLKDVEELGIEEIFEYSENLFDKSKLTEGIVISSTGVETSNGSYSTSDYIELDVGTYSMTKTIDGNVSVAFVSYYTSDKVFVKRTDSTDTINITEKCYVRLSGAKTRIPNVMLVKGDTLPTEYIPYKKEINEDFIPDISGRKIVDESLNTLKTDFIKISSNLVNHRTIKGGYYLAGGSAGKTLSEMEVADSIRGYTDRIYLKPSTTYTCKDIFRIHLFNPNDEEVVYEKSPTAYNVANTFTTPDYETYAMLSLYIGGQGNTFEWQLNEGDTLLDYEKQQISICGHNLINDTNNVGGLSEIKKWNKVVIDKSTPFALSNDIEDYEYKTSTADMIALYDNLMSLNPDYITKTTETVTTDNGTQTFARYDFIEPNLDENGNKHFEQNKVKIILSSGTHPERSGIYGLFYAMREITNNPDLINIRRNCHFVVIPVLNPYGVDNGDRRNANKVDIARNFEVDWFTQSPTNADGTENGTYGGTTFLTEPESVYLDTVLKENKDAIFYASCHSFQLGVTIDDTPVNKPDLFMWCASSTNYVNNIGSKVADKVSRVWRNKYGNTTFENGNNLTDKPTTLLGTSNMASPGGSEGKQAIKYGIQGCTFEVCDWCKFNDNRQSEGYMTQFVVSRACEVYVNLIGTVVDCFDYLDKKLL